MDTTDFQRVKSTNRRRSQRVMLNVRILVAGQDANGRAFSEETTTQIVNAHGALILLRAPVFAGQSLTLKNLKTEEEQPCKVVDVGGTNEGKNEVGVAFPEAAPKFWHIAFPPEDWSRHSAEARTYSPR